MLRKILVVAAALISLPALAHNPDFLSHGDMGRDFGRHHQKMRECIKSSWDAARPSEDQETKAKALFTAAKGVLDQSRNDIMKDKEALKSAWKKYPISKDEVTTAEMTLSTEMKPVKDAFRNAGIDALNLLSSEQRKSFDTAFEACIKNQN